MPEAKTAIIKLKPETVLKRHIRELKNEVESLKVRVRFTKHLESEIKRLEALLWRTQHGSFIEEGIKK